MVRNIFILFLLTVSAVWVSAEPNITAELSAMNIISMQNNSWTYLPSAAGELDIRTPRTSHVQGRLQLRFSVLPVPGTIKQFLSDNDMQELLPLISDAAVVQVPRAYLRFRYPVTDDLSIRITAGKDRITWGFGTVFNAGDLLYGIAPTGTQGLTSFDAVRDETSYLTAVYIPLGEMRYLETVLVPANVNTFPGVGFRFHQAFSNFSLEGSYFYEGDSTDHGFALSMQGSLFAGDAYASVRLKDDLTVLSAIWKRIELTAGMLHAFTAGYDGTVTLRNELYFSPGKYADEIDTAVYHELMYAPNRTVNLFLRGYFNVLDSSAVASAGDDWKDFILNHLAESFSASVMTGFRWNIFQDFDVQAAVSADFIVTGLESFYSSAGFIYRF